MILRKILKVCCVALFGCLIICLLTAPFVFNQNNQVGQHKLVCADSVNDLYSYTSSNWYVSMNRYTGTTPDSSSTVFDNFEITFDLRSDNTVVLGFWNLGNTLSGANSLKYLDNFTYDSWQYFYLNWDSSASYIMHYYRNTGFNNNVYYVNISSMAWAGSNTSIAVTRISFFDNNNNGMRFEFFANYNATTSSGTAQAISRGILYYTSRTYYLNNSLTDNEAYQAGVQYGREQGLASNQQNVYDRGFSAGKRQGDDEGYRRGVNEANQYSFFNLMGAVMDAPVKAFIGLFNFNFLGVNLLNIASGIVTFAVVVRIVRLVLGGR